MIHLRTCWYFLAPSSTERCFNYHICEFLRIVDNIVPVFIQCVKINFISSGWKRYLENWNDKSHNVTIIIIWCSIRRDWNETISVNYSKKENCQSKSQKKHGNLTHQQCHPHCEEIGWTLFFRKVVWLRTNQRTGFDHHFTNCISFDEIQ